MRLALILTLLIPAINVSTSAQTHSQQGVVTTIGNKPLSPTGPSAALTFFENANMTGASYTVQATAATSSEATRVVPSSEITAAGLFGKISSVRLTCGSRPSRANLFDVDWSQSSLGFDLNCNPGQTVDLNLATTPAPNSRSMNDKINAAALVVHVQTSDNLPHSVEMSLYFGSFWQTELQADLAKSGGGTAQQTSIWAEDYQDFHVQQFLQLDSALCTARGAVFDLRVSLSALASKPSVKVYPISVYVDSGFGDLWGCHDKMVQALTQSVRAASDEIESKLPANFPAIGAPATSPVYYIAPDFRTKDYDLFFAK